MDAKATNLLLTVVPDAGLVDEDITITVEGLQPNTDITIAANAKEKKLSFVSFAHYKADSNGNVHLDTMPSSGGTYTGVEPMGIIWSMVPAADQERNTRFLKRNITTPYEVGISLYLGHVDSQDKSRQPVATKTIQRYYMAEYVKRIPVKQGRLNAVFFHPDGPGPYPGLVDLFGTIGGIVEHRAALLASRGFAVLALGYFNPGSENFIINDLEYFEEAVEWVYKQPVVSRRGIGLVGVSMGAILTLKLACICPKVKAVVSINGSHFNSCVPLSYKDKVIPAIEYIDGKFDTTEGGISWYFAYPYVKPIETIPVEDSNAHFLLIQAVDDLAVAPFAADEIPARLRAHGKRNYEVATYQGAGHLIEPPHSPYCRASFHKMFKQMVVWGGNPKDHAKAQDDSWKKIQTFLNKHLSHNYKSNL